MPLFVDYFNEEFIVDSTPMLTESLGINIVGLVNGPRQTSLDPYRMLTGYIEKDFNGLFNIGDRLLNKGGCRNRTLRELI